MKPKRTLREMEIIFENLKKIINPNIIDCYINLFSLSNEDKCDSLCKAYKYLRELYLKYNAKVFGKVKTPQTITDYTQRFDNTLSVSYTLEDICYNLLSYGCSAVGYLSDNNYNSITITNDDGCNHTKITNYPYYYENKLW